MIAIRQSLRQWVALQTGGLQVVTLLDGTTTTGVPVEEASYTGKHFNQKGIRTVVQPDMDVMIMVSPEVFAIDGLWEQHTAVVQQKLSIIYKLSQWIQQSWLVILLLPTIWLFYNYLRVGFPDVWMAAGQSLLVSGIIYLSRRFIVRGFSWVIGRYLRRQLQKYGS